MHLFIDMGGTHLRSELHDGEVITAEVCSSRGQDLVLFIECYLRRYPAITFVGIAFAGQIYEGEILSAPNITVSHPKIVAYFASRYGVRIAIDNDLNCVVRAESAYWKCASIATLWVGTGLGAAVIEGGRLLRGWHNQAFEIGHIPYRKAPFVCGCGKHDCLELFASGSALERWLAYEQGGDSLDTLPTLQQLKAQDTPLVAQFESALLHAVVTLLTLANPHYLVLGGGVIEANGYLVEQIRNALPQRLLPSTQQGVKIVTSQLTNAGLAGAKQLRP